MTWKTIENKDKLKERLNQGVDTIEWWYECPTCHALHGNLPDTDKEEKGELIIINKKIGEGSRRHIIHPKKDFIDNTRGHFKIYCNQKCAATDQL